MKDLLVFCSAWRTTRAGSREVVDGLLRPGSDPADPRLRAALRAWPGRWYWGDPARTHLILIRPLAGRRPRWLAHLALLALTLVSTLGAGAVLTGGWAPAATRGGLGAHLLGAARYFLDLGLGDWRYLLYGWSFAFPLLAILLVHELGHYLAAKRYAIDVSPPYFLPVPPTLSPIGSLGAFIRLRSPVLDRRQLLDVGAAGPLAGFGAALLVLVWGYLTSERIPLVPGAPSYVTLAGLPVVLGDSLLTGALRDLLLPGTVAVHLSAPGFAGWVGLFITALNLLPLSQLDGGHVLYGLLGRRQAGVGLAAILGLLYLAQSYAGWYLWVALALAAGGGRWAHPAVLIPERRIPRSRCWLGWAAMAVFIVTMVPRPIG